MTTALVTAGILAAFVILCLVMFVNHAQSGFHLVWMETDHGYTHKPEPFTSRDDFENPQNDPGF